MNTVMILAIGFVCMACFLTGVNVGQKVVKGEEVKLPVMKPVEKAPVQQEEKKSQLDIILQNIDNYDGTDQGQVDVP